MSVDSPEQLAGLKRAGALVAATLQILRSAVAPGVTTGELDVLAAEFFAASGARSGPILTYDYPGSICISVEDQVVHGIPGPRSLKDGDLVTLDVAAELDGYHADAAITVPVGSVDDEGERLIAGANAALYAGIQAARAGSTLRDIGGAVERTTRSRGFNVIPELTGHGIGFAMHEEPTVFNWPSPAASRRLKPGLVFTIEPMITAGRPGIVLERDGWTIRTADGSRSAHAEHTVMVGRNGPLILTA